MHGHGLSMPFEDQAMAAGYGHRTMTARNILQFTLPAYALRSVTGGTARQHHGVEALKTCGSSDMVTLLVLASRPSGYTGSARTRERKLRIVPGPHCAMPISGRMGLDIERHMIGHAHPSLRREKGVKLTGVLGSMPMRSPISPDLSGVVAWVRIEVHGPPDTAMA